MPVLAVPGLSVERHRSEEHTSELQSHFNLVCRLLLEKKNLLDLIVTCIRHPAAANQTFLVSDGEDLSTTQLLTRMAKALGKPARLLPVPSVLLERGADRKSTRLNSSHT